MCADMYYKLFPGRRLDTTNVKLETYLREPIAVVGSSVVKVEYEEQTTNLPLIVVRKAGPILLGRNWLHAIKLNWGKIHYTVIPGYCNVTVMCSKRN